MTVYMWIYLYDYGSKLHEIVALIFLESPTLLWLIRKEVILLGTPVWKGAVWVVCSTWMNSRPKPVKKWGRWGLVVQTIKNLLQCGRPGFNPWVRKIPWTLEKGMATHFILVMDRGASWAKVHGVTKSWIWLND